MDGGKALEGRAGEEVSLKVADVLFGEPDEFGLGFDAFGNDADVEPGAGGEDGAEDRLAGRVALDAADEAHVELDVVGLEVGEQGEAGVGGAEVVDGEADAERAQLVDEADEAGAVVDKVGFRGFEDDAVEREAGAAGGVDDGEQSVGGGVEAAGKEIEMEGLVEVQAGGELDGARVGDGIEEVEARGRDLAEHLPGRLVPGAADEGFRGDDGAGVGIDDGLKGEAEGGIGWRRRLGV